VASRSQFMASRSQITDSWSPIMDSRSPTYQFWPFPFLPWPRGNGNASLAPAIVSIQRARRTAHRLIRVGRTFLRHCWWSLGQPTQPAVPAGTLAS
jgi:hypothetical protein